MRKQTLLETDENRVTVRVWLAAGFSDKEVVGHASLETHGSDSIYCSVWPKGDDATLSDSRRPLSRRSLGQDIEFKGRPDAIFDLYSLCFNGLLFKYKFFG